MHTHRWIRGLMVVAFVLASSGISHAQTDRRALEAEIKMLRATEKRLSEVRKELQKRVKELEAENARLKKVIAKNIAPDRQTPAVDATAFVIRVSGQIGLEFTSVKMKRCLEEAVALSPTVVVLEIDTPGGSTKDAEEIVDEIIDYKGLRFVAFVHKAISAGSTITLACKEVYVTEDAVIGAATAWTMQRGRLPRALAEKQMSIWRAMGRKAAENGGHSKLFAEAMVDPDFALTMHETDGKVVLERNGVGEVLKAKGKILTLTAREAVKSGLAKGRVKDLDGLADTLDMTGWKVVYAKGTAVAQKTPGKKSKPADFTVDVCHETLMAKANELGLLKRGLTALQREKANKDWQTWLEAEKLKERKVRWTLKLVNATSRKRQTDQLEKNLTAAKAKFSAAKTQYERVRRARVGTRGEFSSVGEKKRTLDLARQAARDAKETVDKYEEAIDDAKTYPVAVLANSPENARVLVAAYVHKSDKDVLSAMAAKSDLTVEGELAGLTLLQTSPGVASPAVVVRKGRLIDADK